MHLLYILYFIADLVGINGDLAMAAGGNGQNTGHRGEGSQSRSPDLHAVEEAAAAVGAASDQEGPVVKDAAGVVHPGLVHFGQVGPTPGEEGSANFLHPHMCASPTDHREPFVLGRVVPAGPDGAADREGIAVMQGAVGRERGIFENHDLQIAHGGAAGVLPAHHQHRLVNGDVCGRGATE